MNRILLGVFSVALCFSLGYTLQCFECNGVWDLCITTKKTCADKDHCFFGVGEAVGLVKLKMKGCLDVAQCNKTTDIADPMGKNKTMYKMTKTCCDSDLCNAVAPLANTHTLTLAIGSLVALLLTKALM